MIAHVQRISAAASELERVVLAISAVIPTWIVAALHGVATSGEVVERVESPHGEKYLVDGPLESPTGRKPLVRTVWIVDRGEQAPRLVAYPGEE